MAANHTPGPWYVENHAIMVNQPWRAYLGEGAPETVCEMVSSLSPEATAANARLIAAAPELLAALEGMFNGTCFCDFAKGGYTHHGRHCEIARAAIAKAKGETA
jgi:hypothetical protein